jgi:hypothetical protein
MIPRAFAYERPESVADAVGARDLDMPLQPMKVWDAIQKGGAR